MRFIASIIFTLALVILASSCKQNFDTPLLNSDYRDSSTIMMAQELESIYNSIPPQSSMYRNSGRSKIFFNQAQKSDISQKLTLEFRAAYEELLAGNSMRSIEECNRLINVCEQLEMSNKIDVIKNIKKQLALSYIRLGEQENCIINHNASSCIFPLDDEAIHKSRRGSENAIQIYLELLDSEPQNLTLHYLLNVAYMTLGRYPNDVPDQYLIPLLHPEKIIYPNLKISQAIYL